MQVIGVAMERVDDRAFGEILLLVLGDHLDGLLVTRLLVKGVDRAVIGARLAGALVRPLQLILVALARILGQIRATLFVSDLFGCGLLLLRHRPVSDFPLPAVDVLRHVLRPDPLVITFGRALLRVVIRAVAGAARGSHAELDANAHRLIAPDISCMMLAASAVARSIFS